MQNIRTLQQPHLGKKSKELRVGDKRNDAYYNGHLFALLHTLRSDQYFILLPVEDKQSNSTPFCI